MKHESMISAIREAAERGRLHSFPLAVLTQKRLRSQDTSGNSIFHTASAYGHFNQLPKNLLTLENMLLTNNSGDTVLHIVSMEEESIKHVPKEILTEQALMTKNNSGSTVFHEIAFNGLLNLIPEELLHTNSWTNEVDMFKTDGCGNNVLHLAAQHAQLDKLPKRALNEKFLMRKDAYGETAFYHAMENNSLDQLLGIEFSTKVQKIVGDTWFQKNAEFCKHNQKALNSLLENTTTNDIDLF